MSKKSLLLSFAIISLLLSACATDNVKTSKKSSGDIYYVKDNSYYVTKKDGTRYVLSEDDVENNIAYEKRKNIEFARSGGLIDFSTLFSGFDFGNKQNADSLEEIYSKKNYYPNNFYDLKNNLSIVEIDYDSDLKSFSYKVSTGSIINKENVKKVIDDEKEYLIEETIEDVVIEIPFNNIEDDKENTDEVPSFIEREFIDETDSANFIDDIEQESENTSEDRISKDVDSSDEIADRIYGIKEGNYYHDKKNNLIYYYTENNEIKKYDYIQRKKELIDKDVKALKMYGQNVIFFKNDKVFFYTIGKGVESSFDIELYVDSFFKKDDSNNVYFLSGDETFKLYVVNNKTGLKLIDEGVDKIFGLTKNRIIYSKDNIITLPYRNVLIDDVTSGEFIGKEPILKDYKLSDDPLSLDFDIEKYTTDRFSYKIKEKFYNDRKRYIDKYAEGIKEGGEQIVALALMSSDGNNNKLINGDGVVNVRILDEDEDVVYFETDLNLNTIQFTKKKLSEFVTSSYSVDSFISPLLDNRKKAFSYYVDKAGVVYHINDLDLFRKYIERESKLIYDTAYNKELNELEKRKIHYKDNQILISGNSSIGDKKVAFHLSLDKETEVFADSIDMSGYRDIHFVGCVDNLVYLLEDDSSKAVLKHGIKEISKNVYVGSAVIDNANSNIAYVTKNTEDNINFNGQLHKYNFKKNEDYIVSENAFAYNLVFDNDQNLYYILKYTVDENMGTLISLDANNKKHFIDDKVIYILKY